MCSYLACFTVKIISSMRYPIENVSHTMKLLTWSLPHTHSNTCTYAMPLTLTIKMAENAKHSDICVCMVLILFPDHFFFFASYARFWNFTCLAANSKFHCIHTANSQKKRERSFYKMSRESETQSEQWEHHFIQRFQRKTEGVLCFQMKFDI